MLVFDISDPASWENLKNVWYEMAFKRVPNANYLVLGNKKDLARNVDLEDIQRWCK